jgi:hypothetical protein
LRRLRRCAAVAFAVLSAICWSPAWGQEGGLQADLARAAALVREGRAEEAWQLLSPQEPQYAGRTDFDLQLAVAALESGRENLATFILERVLARNPEHVAARLELARALYALRDYERAQREFDAVLRAGPPESIRTAVQGYQARMRGGGPAAERPTGAYAEISVGRDDNVTAASSQGSVFVPSLGTDFVPAHTRQADAFMGIGAGVEGVRPLGGGKALLGAADVRLRRHDDMGEFDSQVFDLQGALQLPAGEHARLRLGLSHNEYRLDDSSYRRVQSASGQWSRMVAEPTRLTVHTHASRIRYLREDVREISSNLLVLGVGGAHALRSGHTLSASVQVGYDEAVAERADGDRVLRGMSLAWEAARLLPSVEAFAAGSFLRSEYRRDNPDFGVLRRDRQAELVLGLSWQVAPGWQLRPQLAHTENRSNLELNDYHRTEFSLTLRRAWN